MNPGINLVHLKFFCDAVVYESISEAAKMNYISQSAVSQAITKLETIFGRQLVYYHRQRLTLTEEGKIVFNQAHVIFKSVQETFDKVNQTKKEITGTLRFVTTKSLGMSFIAPSYRLLKQNLPLLDFKFRMGGLNLIRMALKREEAEFAIVVYDHNFDQFEKFHLRKGLFHLYQSKEAPSRFIEQGVFVDDFDGMYVKELQSHLNENGLQKKILNAISGWELVARFTQLNIGVGFFPDYIISNNRYPNIDIHSLDRPIFDYEICAIYNKGIKLSRNAQSFLENFSLE